MNKFTAIPALLLLLLLTTESTAVDQNDPAVLKKCTEFYDTLKMIFGEKNVETRYSKVRILNEGLYENMRLLNAEF